MPAVVIKAMKMGNGSRRIAKRTGGKENNPSDIDLKLVFYNVLEKSAVDVEWLSVMDGSVGFGLFGPIPVFEIPVPFEFL